jgi:hypothetical protein
VKEGFLWEVFVKELSTETKERKTTSEKWDVGFWFAN